MKSVQISKALFIDLVNYFMPDEGEVGVDKDLESRIIDEIQDKIERLGKHFDYFEKIKQGEIIKSKDRLIIL